MSAHLLQVNIGPIQDFIAAARRSRDLWHGSHLLSELSRCVARTIAKGGGELIFPALGRDANGKWIGAADPELQPCPTPLRPKGHPKEGRPPVNVANIILAVVPEGKDPQALARAARDELQRFWAKLAEDVKKNCGGLIATAPGIDAAWDEQIATFLEFAAAWVSLSESANAYTDARKALAKAIAARKNLRDFEPWKHQRGSQTGLGVAKSSLDGARETVLAEPAQREKKPVRKYRIGEGEQLDAVGLVKRAGGETEESRNKNELQFVPVINVALGPWLKAAKDACKQEFENLDKEVWKIGLARVKRDLPCAKPFGFDASIFLENRVWPSFKEQGLREDEFQDEKEWRNAARKWERQYVAPILSSPVKRPFPYVACLAADGDGMGKAINKIGQGAGPIPAHVAFSAELAGFAREARKIVEQDHMGSLVYSGGDDVLAFLPLSTALKCAEALRLKFAGIMEAACFGMNEKERPTLSVGLGVGHVLESMGELLNLGRKAEKLAKGGHLPTKQRRNALAIQVDKRSGGSRSWRAQWNDPALPGDPAKGLQPGPVARLEADRKLLRGELSTRKVYEIAETLRRFPKPEPDPGGIWPGILEDEVARSLKRADGGNGALTLEELGLPEGLSGLPYKDAHKAVENWVDRLLIAKTFAEGEPRKEAAAREAEGAAA